MAALQPGGETPRTGSPVRADAAARDDVALLDADQPAAAGRLADPGSSPDPGSSRDPGSRPDPGHPPVPGSAVEPGHPPQAAAAAAAVIVAGTGTGPASDSNDSADSADSADASGSKDSAGSEAAGTLVPEPDQAAQPHVRVDARLLEAALLNLRKRVASAPLVFQIDGAAEIRTERTKVLSQIDDYLLPRVRRSAAPVLVALVGSTGAGKSTLVNSVVGTRVSATGVRRPTTNSPVLACHPDDIDWFAENNFLPTLPRVRQEGLARPGRDGLLVLAASAGMPRGIALLDTPDINSVAKAHREFAYQFLDASDLWLFMTSSSRYADGPVWEILQHARDRKAALGVVLSRVPQAYRTELVDHFNAMLDANGIAAANRFVIQEIPLIDGMLPADAYQPIREWLEDTAARADRRVAVLTQTMSGVLDTFKSRVPTIAAHVEAQVVLRGRLRALAEQAYRHAVAKAGDGLTKGVLLRGEVLARWQDCMVTGDAAPPPPRAARKKGKRARRGPTRTGDAERPRCVRRWSRSSPRSRTAPPSRSKRSGGTTRRAPRCWPAPMVDKARGEQAKQIFESAFGASRTGVWTGIGEVDPSTQATAFSRSSPDLPLRAARSVSAWQDHLIRLVLRPPTCAQASLRRPGARPGGPGDHARRGRTRRDGILRRAAVPAS